MNAGKDREKKKSRYQTLLDRHGTDIFKRLQADETGREFGADAASAFARFASFDPTAADKSVPYRYLQWLCRAYLESFRDGAEGIKAEDIYKIRDDLSFFHDLKKTRPHGAYEKDVYKYTAGSLADFVIRETASETKSNTRLMKDLKDEIRAETEFLYDGPEGLIVIPKTERASCFWGQGTRWCTAAKDDNKFDCYNDKGPLVIYIPSSGEKTLVTLKAAEPAAPATTVSLTEKFQGHASAGLADVHDTMLGTAPESLAPLAKAVIKKKPGILRFLVTKGRFPIPFVPSCHFEDPGFCFDTINAPMSSMNSFYAALEKTPDAHWQDPGFRGKVCALNWNKGARNAIARRLLVLPPHSWNDSGVCFDAIYLCASMDVLKVALAITPDACWQDPDFRDKFHNVGWNKWSKDARAAITGRLLALPPHSWNDPGFCFDVIDLCTSMDVFKVALARTPDAHWQDPDFHGKVCALEWGKDARYAIAERIRRVPSLPSAAPIPVPSCIAGAVRSPGRSP